MKVAIIEDELPAARHLKRLLTQIDPAIEVVETLDSVEGAVEWLAQSTPDLILCDIQLGDGLALTIFERVRVPCPIVFCTAYDDYWTQAFAAGGIDYVLKPIERERLAAAIDKYRELEKHFAGQLAARLERLLHPDPPSYRQRILAKRGVDHVSVPVEQVAYFTTEHKLVIMVDVEGTQYLLDGSLTDVAQSLDPAAFFRANRKFVIAFHAVESFRAYAKGRVHVRVRQADEPIVVSQENARRFRGWMER